MEPFYKKATTYTFDKSLFLILCLFAFGCAESEDFAISENIDTKNGLSETSGTVMIYSDSTQNACVVLSEERIVKNVINKKIV